MALPTGTKLNQYEILSPIGVGGMGEVYRARDAKLQRDVAIKVLPPMVSADRERLKRFHREATTIAALNHPNIVTIFGIEETDGHHYIAMELVEGKTLAKMIPAGGMPLAKIVDIAIPLSDALATAHEKGIVHRDLKPENVMVTRDGRVKVLDFGLAKLTDEPRAAHALDMTVSAPLTSHGTIVGTVPYMSPEQLRNDPVDHRTDLFALGIMLYEMATGDRPFQGTKSADVMSSILRDTPPPLHERNSKLPRPLSRIVAQCLEKDPRNRLQSALDVRNKLTALRKDPAADVNGPPVPAPPATAPAPTVPERAAARETTATVGSVLAAPTVRGEFWIGVVLVIAAMGGLLWFVSRRGSGPDTSVHIADSAAVFPKTGDSNSSTPPAARDVSSVAVLPFKNLSSDPEQEYFSDGLTEELLNALAKVPELKVTGRTSSFMFKGKTEDLRAIGEKLGVANILEGSVRKSGDTVRITAQLAKAADGFHVWSESYDRKLDDIFAVQDDIAKSVAQALQVTLLGRSAAAKKPHTEAYDLVLRARYVLQSRTPDSVPRARDMLERALSLSPDYAPAWAEMGLVHRRTGEMAASIDDRQKANQAAREALSKALALDPELAVAHARLATVQTESWEFEAAQRSMEKALAADPRNAMVLGNAAVLYANLGRLQEAIALGEQALDADPLTPHSFTNLAGFYARFGMPDDAEALCQKALALKPNFLLALWFLGGVELLRGHPAEAQASFAKYNELAGGGEQTDLWVEALVSHTAGNGPASATAADELERRFGADDPYGCAQVRAWRGEADAAFEWLDKAVGARDPLLAILKSDIYIAPLQTDARWKALLRRIGLPVE